mmetsp:Transcript_23293/g.75469  ORF Transcript_23293/g.75469 Transcript_23293/m.75469 type:complete len:200 (+) Transcript_23293:942-1541(+)
MTPNVRPEGSPPWPPRELPRPVSRPDPLPPPPHRSIAFAQPPVPRLPSLSRQRAPPLRHWPPARHVPPHCEVAPRLTRQPTVPLQPCDAYHPRPRWRPRPPPQPPLCTPAALPPAASPRQVELGAVRLDPTHRPLQQRSPRRLPVVQPLAPPLAGTRERIPLQLPLTPWPRRGYWLLLPQPLLRPAQPPPSPRRPWPLK